MSIEKQIFSRVIFFTCLLFLILCCGIGWKLWENNCAVQYPAQANIEQSLNRGIVWLGTNRANILTEENPMLWWMIKQSAELTQNATLLSLYGDYKQRYLDSNPRNVWVYLFDANARVLIDPHQLENVPDYNLFFLYASSCDSLLAQEPVVIEQLSPTFCDARMLSPACVTHQLMGLRIAQRYQCGDVGKINEASRQLQERILSQLFWDFRVVDVYLQRVWVMVESGAGDRIKPIWIQRVLSVQNADGGWSGFESLISLSNQRSLGFSSKGIDIGVNESNFHTTAQGVFLMSLLSAGR